MQQQIGQDRFRLSNSGRKIMCVSVGACALLVAAYRAAPPPRAGLPGLRAGQTFSQHVWDYPEGVPVEQAHGVHVDVLPKRIWVLEITRKLHVTIAEFSLKCRVAAFEDISVDQRRSLEVRGVRQSLRHDKMLAFRTNYQGRETWRAWAVSGLLHPFLLLSGVVSGVFALTFTLREARAHRRATRMQCAECGYPIPIDASVCPECGNQQTR